MKKFCNKIVLVPAKPADRKKVYNWLCNWNDGTVFTDLPSFEEMQTEEEEYFYNGSSPEKGMYFIIESGEEETGCISYTCYHLKPGIAEFDIWLKDESVCGNGFGNMVIQLLLEKIKTDLGIHTVLIRPAKKNIRAVKAYKKCGFKEMIEDISAYMKPEYLEQYGPGDCGIEGTENLIKFL